MIVLPPAVQKRIVKHTLARNVYPTAIGFFPKAGYHDVDRPEGSAEYIFIYCLEGRGSISVNGLTHSIGASAWFIIPKKAVHSYSSDTAQPWSIYWVHFDGSAAATLFQRYLQHADGPVQLIPFHEQILRAFEHLYTTMEHSLNDRELERAHLYLMHFLGLFIYADAHTESGDENDPVRSATDTMRGKLNDTVNVEALAAAQHMSVSHFCRIFRQKTGYSPISYFNHLKIQRAGQYLFFTDLSIKEICAELGFADPYYFSRLFAKIMGTPPSQYRKTYRNKL